VKRLGSLVLVAAALFFHSRAAFAHEFRPHVLDIRELGAGKYAVFWLSSASTSDGALSGGASEPIPVLPAHCSALEGPGGAPPRLLDCGSQGLAGATIEIKNLAQARVEAIVRYSAADGAVTTAVLRAGSASFTVPGGAGAPRGAGSIFVNYLASGVDHILRGWDHLIFVIGLLLLVKGARTLVHTITAFTVAHSLTLGLAVTGAVRVPQGPAEALIALSLMLLAAEIARPPSSASLARRRPWAMAFVFGLLHGFGFAGALAELGLPQGEIPLALFAFNVGVETGQLAVVLTALGTAWLALQITPPRSSARESPPVDSAPKNWISLIPAYAIGAPAAFWFIERLMKLGS
jgi:hypothetical protein